MKDIITIAKECGAFGTQASFADSSFFTFLPAQLTAYTERIRAEAMEEALAGLGLGWRPFRCPVCGSDGAVGAAAISAQEKSE